MNKLPTIHELRAAGNKIRISHFRYVVKPYNKMIRRDEPPIINLLRVTKVDKKSGAISKLGEIYAKGGRTEIEFTNYDNAETYKTEAKCNVKDAFNRKRGILICLGRLRAQGVI